jgi:hypothetical protein
LRQADVPSPAQQSLPSHRHFSRALYVARPHALNYDKFTRHQTPLRRSQASVISHLLAFSLRYFCAPVRVAFDDFSDIFVSIAAKFKILIVGALVESLFSLSSQERVIFAPAEQPLLPRLFADSASSMILLDADISHYAFILRVASPPSPRHHWSARFSFSPSISTNTAATVAHHRFQPTSASNLFPEHPPHHHAAASTPFRCR